MTEQQKDLATENTTGKCYFAKEQKQARWTCFCHRNVTEPQNLVVNANQSRWCGARLRLLGFCTFYEFFFIHFQNSKSSSKFINARLYAALLWLAFQNWVIEKGILQKFKTFVASNKTLILASIAFFVSVVDSAFCCCIRRNPHFFIENVSVFFVFFSWFMSHHYFWFSLNDLCCTYELLVVWISVWRSQQNLLAYALPTYIMGWVVWTDLVFFFGENPTCAWSENTRYHDICEIHTYVLQSAISFVQHFDWWWIDDAPLIETSDNVHRYRNKIRFFAKRS